MENPTPAQILAESFPKHSVMDIMEDEFAEPVAPQPQPAVQPPIGKPSSPGKVFRDIDLHDGSGVQHFEADSYEKLTDVLVTAQTNATKKIRDQNKQLKRPRAFNTSPDLRVEAGPAAIPELTQEQVFLLQNEPAKLAQFLGAIIQEMNDTRKFKHSVAQQQREANEAQAFLETHAEDYFPAPENWNAMSNYLQSHNWPLNRTNLELAFEDLNASGLLAVPEEVAPQPAPSRIEQPAPAAPQPARPVSTGLPANLGTEAPPQPEAGEQNLSQVAAEIARLPMEQARQRINALMHAQRTKQS